MDKTPPSAEKVLELIPQGVSLDALRDKGFLPAALDGVVLTVMMSDYTSLTDAQIFAPGIGCTLKTELYPAA